MSPDVTYLEFGKVWYVTKKSDRVYTSPFTIISKIQIIYINSKAILIHF